MEQNNTLDHLVTRYPRLFRDGPLSNSHLPEGWVAIVDRLCGQIDALLDDAAVKHFRVRQIKEKFGALRFYWALGGQMTTAVDIIGQGRFEIGPKKPSETFNKIRALVGEAETASATACERCGAPSRMRLLAGNYTATTKGYFNLGEEAIPGDLSHGYMTCLCDAHVDDAAASWAGKFKELAGDDDPADDDWEDL